MTHTKEPWSVAEDAFDNDGIPESVIRGLDERAAIAVTLEFGTNNPGMREANARRIVACVNACAGIPNVQLECDKVQFIEALKERNEFKKQRDEYAEAFRVLWISHGKEFWSQEAINKFDALLERIEK